MRTWTKWAVLVVLAAGCGGADTADAEEPNELEAREAPPPDDGDDGQDGRPGRGPRMLKEALADIEMTDEQRTKIDALLAPPDEDRREAFRAHHEAIVAAVRTGNQTDLARLVDERPADRAEHVAKVLNGIHETLNADQRRALVASIRQQFADHDGGGGRGRRHGGGGRHGGGRHERMLEDLGLTDAQRSRLEAARAEAGLERPSRDERRAHHEGRRAHFEEMLAAFERDDFDATRVLPSDEEGGPMARHGKELLVLVPILTPEQREKLADKMESHFERGPR